MLHNFKQTQLFLTLGHNNRKVKHSGLMVSLTSSKQNAHNPFPRLHPKFFLEVNRLEAAMFRYDLPFVVQESQHLQLGAWGHLSGAHSHRRDDRCAPGVDLAGCQ